MIIIKEMLRHPKITLSYTVGKYAETNGYDSMMLAKLASVSILDLEKIAKVDFATPEVLKKINKTIGVIFTYAHHEEPDDPFAVPAWIKKAPAAIRNLIAQEFLVNLDTATYFFENAKTKEDIYRLRRKLREIRSEKPSSFCVEATFLDLIL